jgi:hypothetical protein
MVILIVNIHLMTGMTHYDYLLPVLEDFRSYLGDEKFLFTYIAPKEREHYYTFLRNIYNSSISHSLYLTLGNPQTVRKLLEDMQLLENTEMEIYIASNDLYSTRWFNENLRTYIRKHNLKFEY